MNTNKFQFPTIAKWIVSVLIIVLVLYGIWYFRFLFGCLAIAIVLSFMGRPIMRLLSKITIGKYKINNTISVSITLMLIITIISTLFYFLVPLIISQATSFANLDIYRIADYYHEPILQVETLLHEYQLMPQELDLETMISNRILEIFNVFNLTKFAEVLLGLSGNIVMGFFIVIFFTFFMLKDAYLLYNFIIGVTPDEYIEEVDHIIDNTRNLISRYFIGIFSEILIMTGLLSIGFYLVGFSNVLLAAFSVAVMVILPYIGVIIGGALGLTIIITSFLSVNANVDIVPIIMNFLIVFGVVKLLDDFVLQPLIYSKSVKAHPLEVFIVILMAGQLGGVIGMILAIPTYTFIRIIAKEFFSNWKIVQTITKDI